MTLTAVLFVGGESRRMGADKATRLWDGEPLWARQLRTLRELSPEKILISARTKPVWCPTEIETVLDEPPPCGPLGGLAAALKQIQTTHLLALAVDLPQMNSDYLRGLWRQAQPGLGVVPEQAGFFEPLCAVYPVAAVMHAAGEIQAGRLTLQDFIRRLLAMKLMLAKKITAPDLFWNVNTPTELEPISGQVVPASGIEPLTSGL